MARSPRIAVIGSANTDLTTFADAFPRPGETIFGKSFDLGFGGKGANQAVAARLCGADVVMIANVGNDLFGKLRLKIFLPLASTPRMSASSTGFRAASLRSSWNRVVKTVSSL